MAVATGVGLGFGRLAAHFVGEAAGLRVARVERVVLREVAGVERVVQREVAGVERLLLRELARRLESVAEDQPAEPQPQSLAASMQQMLRRSMDQTRSDSRRLLFEHMVRELVPDEARILAALADGSTYPLIDVAFPGRGMADHRALRNASNVGRAAGVADPSLVPRYVAHLLALGLAEAGQEDSGLRDEYEILATDSQVKSACAAAANGARRSPRIVRRTLRISALGGDFWAACRVERR